MISASLRTAPSRKRAGSSPVPHRKGNTQIKVTIIFPVMWESLIEAEKLADDWMARLSYDRRIPQNAEIKTEIWSEAPDGSFTNATQKLRHARQDTPIDPMTNGD